MNEQILSNSNNDQVQPANASRGKILLVAFLLCLICSSIVSGVAISLRPLQAKNAQLMQTSEILKVAGIDMHGKDIDSLFAEHIVVKVVDLRSGDYAEDIDHTNFDERIAARTENTSSKLNHSDDIAQIKRRTNFARVYLIYDRYKHVETIILPVHGYGLWSIMYGYIGLSIKTDTIKGLTFYEHNETAGLGSEISNPNWLAQFKGKRVFDDNGQPIIQPSKTAHSVLMADIAAQAARKSKDDNTTTATTAASKESADEKPQIVQSTFDAISGATLTTNGVNNLLHFWLSDLGFGPYLARLRQQYR